MVSLRSPRMTRGVALASAIGVALALSSSLSHARVLARVDGAEITDDDVKVALEDIGPGLSQKIQGPEREQYVLDYLIDMKLVAKEAEKEKFGATPEFARREAYYHDKLLMEAELGDIASKAATDEAEHKAYDEAAKAQPPEPEIHARHILVPTEAEAKAALARVKAGEDFAKVATELSKDPASEGGDLGWFTHDKMVPEFADAAFKLKPGEVSEPVKTQFGWHIIKVEEARTKTFPPFDQVKDQAARYVVQKAQSDLITKLHDGVKIEKIDAPAEAAPAPAAPAAAAPATPAPATAAPADPKKP